MSFPTYPAYKDSGVEWLGQVPSHWKVSAVKFLLKPDGYKAGPFGSALITSALNDLGGVLVMTPEHVARQSFDLEFNQYLPEDRESAMDVFQVQQGDVVLPIVGTLGRAMVIEKPVAAILNQRLARISPDPEQLRPKLLKILLTDYDYFKQLDVVEGKGAILSHITKESLINRRLAVPPLAEQDQILTILESETAKIDALVAEQERLIELLKEKRQAVISHAVTKGLDPSVPMKDSGVEWLGEVPAHWSAVRLKFVAADIKAGPFGSALTKDMYASSGYRVYGQEQVIPGDFSLGDYYIDEATFAQLAQYATQEGDVLISCVGTFGKIAVVPENAEPGIINPRLMRLRVIDDVSPNYLAEVLRSTVTFEQFSVLSRGGTMDVINIGTLSDIWVAVPPYFEQQSILEELQKLMSEFEALVAEAVLSIELLRERRTALISAAVTGQIDIREKWAAKATQ